MRDIVEMGRRRQKAWTSHRPGASNAVGDSFGQLTDEIERLRALNGELLDALKALRSLINEGGVPRYTVTPGAALNSVIEERVDPALAKAEGNAPEVAGPSTERKET